ncbi:2'-5' RNA ligase family protein [Actinophytocola gossypii]|uniref:2'-5' RNA ligase family protein n=1 Tax=Actinophytocola gossypii TaxID=2812003 RepID=A0ABT2JIR6_9PSEU|nr:2'-5' RNA ligase family protein [Actinophytocola gossypii]MCT2587772.1 2'-5' RNA ligase family protein [Actinophytocola gossypii]
MTNPEPVIPPAHRLTNHWYSRAGWHPGRLFDTWHLVFDDAPLLHDLATRCKNSLADLPGLNYVPNEWLHMTVQGVGWTDELSSQDRNAVIHRAAAELKELGARDITVGPPIVKGEALVLAGTPVRFLVDIRDRLRVAVQQALGRAPWEAAEQAKGFMPHVSIAYAQNDADAAPYAAALGKVSPASVRVPIRHVALIRQERQLDPNWRYVWQELARVPLKVVQ